MDYILQFDNEAAAQAALPQLYSAEFDWNESVCAPGIHVYRVTGTTTDADGIPTETHENAPGWFIRIGNADSIPDNAFDQTGWICSPVFAGG